MPTRGSAAGNHSGYAATISTPIVLVFNTVPTAIPTAASAGPDAILGEPDQNSDDPPANTESFQTPSIHSDLPVRAW